MPVRRFRGDATAARCARRAVREELSDALTKRRLADVELLVSELATNSVRHAGCAETDEISIRADVKPDRVRVSMFDPGDGFGVWFEVQRERLPFGDERGPRAQPA